MPDDLDEGRIADSFVHCLEAIDETSTMYAAIKRLPPAHWMSIDGGKCRTARYWTPVSVRPACLPTTDAEWIEGVRGHLAEAVRCRMRACTTVGSMLSGGLDSSSIVALASAECAAEGTRLATYSAVSSRADCAETAAIGAMRQAFHLRSTCIDAGNAEALLDQVAAGWATLAQPFDAWMTLVECLYLSAGRAGTRVMLDGLDADSLFSEGDLAGELLRARRWRQLWSELQGSANIFGWRSSLSALRPEFSRRVVPNRVRDWLAPIRRRREAAILARSGRLDPAFAERIGLERRLAVRAGAGQAPSRTDPDRTAYSCIGLSTITAGVERYGRLAARHGLEPRHPFLDRRLVEFCAWIPLTLRQREGWPKWVLRRAMQDVLPGAIAWRRGKEHLGSEFSWHLGTAARRRSATGNSARPYIRATGAPCLPDVSRTFASMQEVAWESDYFLTAFRAWMDGHDSRHGKRA
ncbi:MAG: asparagine synthase-related protein [Arenimonas sp.]